MKRTIKTRIFTVNLFTIILLLVITAAAFNLAASSYLEKDTIKQLKTIASSAEKVMRARFPHPSRRPGDDEYDLAKSYISLMMAMRIPSSSINAEYALIDNSDHLITPFENFDNKPSVQEIDTIQKILDFSKTKDLDEVTFSEKGMPYAAVLKPVLQGGNTKIGTLVIYSSLDKIKQIQNTINSILLIILAVAAILVIMLSAYLSRRISTPLSALCKHIRNLSELNFSNTLFVPADNEIQELVQNINTLAEKLDTHNKSQKLFLQNASHEFRTPIMSIQSHAEGILYGVVEGPYAAKIILDESKRLTHLVEELLYLSRLDAIEEVYKQEPAEINTMLKTIHSRMSSIAQDNNILIFSDLFNEELYTSGDIDKLERCFTNIISNGIRYARTHVNIEVYRRDNEAVITISDDGPGFEKDEEKLIFNRFYKGRKGSTGLGLAISKSIIEKHRGTISAYNSTDGAEFCLTLPLSSSKA